MFQFLAIPADLLNIGGYLKIGVIGIGAIAAGIGIIRKITKH